MYSAAVSSSSEPVTMMTGVPGRSLRTTRRASWAVNCGSEWSESTTSGVN